MPAAIAAALYRAFTSLALPFVLGYFYWRGRREAAYREHWAERAGDVEPRSDRPIWIHAASVGEVNLAVALIERIRAGHDVPILLSTMTPTGRDAAHRALGDQGDVVYVPLDLRTAVRRFVLRTRPRCFIAIETELWPNLVYVLSRAAIPMALVNATISPRSAARYGAWPLRGLAGDVLSRFSLIAAASTTDRDRFTALGAPEATTRAIGQLKYDLVAPATTNASPDATALNDRPVIVAGSTHEGEESRLLATLSHLKPRFSDLLLVLVPRHAQRFDAVATLLADSDWRWARHSAGEPAEAIDVLLVDALGELAGFYARADIAVVGGTLVPGIGGHNVIEPAAAGVPIIVGPHGDDWQEIIAPWITQGGAFIADDEAAFIEQATAWLDDPALRHRLGQANAEQVAAAHGALARTVAALETIGCLHD